MRSRAPREGNKKLQINKNCPLKREPLEGCLHPSKGSGATVGYHKKGYPNQTNKNRKKGDKADHPRSPGLGRRFRLARPLGLVFKFRLARPLLGSGTNTASPEPPSWSQASNTWWPYHRHDMRCDPQTAAGHGSDCSNHPSYCLALLLSLYSLTSFTVMYRLTVKEVWKRLTCATVGCLSPTVTGHTTVSPIRPP